MTYHKVFTFVKMGFVLLDRLILAVFPIYSLCAKICKPSIAFNILKTNMFVSQNVKLVL